MTTNLDHLRQLRDHVQYSHTFALHNDVALLILNTAVADLEALDSQLKLEYDKGYNAGIDAMHAEASNAVKEVFEEETKDVLR